MCVSVFASACMLMSIFQISQNRIGQMRWLSRECCNTQVHKGSVSTGWHCYEFGGFFFFLLFTKLRQQSIDVWYSVSKNEEILISLLLETLTFPGKT